MAGGKTQLQRAITQISEKAPPPDIDFTQHTLEDGTNVSTQERVIKDVRLESRDGRRQARQPLGARARKPCRIDDEA